MFQLIARPSLGHYSHSLMLPSCFSIRDLKLWNNDPTIIGFKAKFEVHDRPQTLNRVDLQVWKLGESFSEGAAKCVCKMHDTKFGVLASFGQGLPRILRLCNVL